METFKEAYMRHDRLANEALSEAQRLKALAPAGALTRGVIHSGCTGQAIGLEHIADTGFTGYGSSADYRASRND